MSARVLVVDDDDDLRAALCETLAAAGYQTISARDGADALDKLEVLGSDCSLILLDLMMPRMDGWQFREAQLRDPALAGIPVVVLTARSHSDVATLGVTEVLAKPVHLEGLLSTVRRHCGGR